MWIWEKGFMARRKSRYTKKLGIFEEKKKANVAEERRGKLKDTCLKKYSEFIQISL